LRIYGCIEFSSSWASIIFYYINALFKSEFLF
jgi:hypothetical protein